MYGHISNGFLVHIESKNEKNHHFIQILEIFLSQNAIQRGAKEEVYQSKCKIERERERNLPYKLSSKRYCRELDRKVKS